MQLNIDACTDNYTKYIIEMKLLECKRILEPRHDDSH